MIEDKNYYTIRAAGSHYEIYIGENGSLTSAYGNAKRVTEAEAKRAFHSSEYYLGESRLFKMIDNKEHSEYVERVPKLVEDSSVPRHYVIIANSELRVRAIVSAPTPYDATNKITHLVFNNHGWYDAGDLLSFKPTRIEYGNVIDKQATYNNLNGL